MHLIPAIDLLDSQVVRLRHGDYAQVTRYGDGPLAIAQRYRDAGATWIHVVDLGAARDGSGSNEHATLNALQSLGLKVQFGGGLRTAALIEHALALGVARVVIGTAALRDPAMVERMCRKYPQRIVVGVDSKGGRVHISGWLEGSDIDTLTLGKEAQSWGAAAVLFTEIERDGALGGPALEATAALQAELAIDVIASGGVTSLDDVAALARVGVRAAVCGRALLEGKLDFATCVALPGVRS